jgi:hypothetical protein
VGDGGEEARAAAEGMHAVRYSDLVARAISSAPASEPEEAPPSDRHPRPDRPFDVPAETRMVSAR